MWYGDGIGNTVWHLPLIQCTSCYQQMHAVSKTLFQQSLTFLNCGLWLTQFGVHNGHKMVKLVAVRRWQMYMTLAMSV